MLLPQDHRVLLNVFLWFVRYRFVAIYLPLGLLGVINARWQLGDRYWSHEFTTAVNLTIGLWILAILGSLTVVPLALIALRMLDAPRRRRWTRAVRQICVRCGYDLRATRDRCPECGTPKTSVSVAKEELRALNERTVLRALVRWFGLPR